MSTEEMIETLITEGMKAYKKNSKSSERGRKLNRHEPIECEGYTFTYWREYATYRAGQWIKEILPDAIVEVFIEGNNSTLSVELSNEEQQKLNCKLYNFLEKHSFV